jgi:hypothetical protein
MVIACGNRDIKVHRMVLEAASPFLSDLASKAVQHNRDLQAEHDRHDRDHRREKGSIGAPRIRLTDSLKTHAVEMVHRFWYTGCLTKPDEDASLALSLKVSLDVLLCANEFHMHYLVEHLIGNMIIPQLFNDSN